jgi:hypothetical protein
LKITEKEYQAIIQEFTRRFLNSASVSIPVRAHEIMPKSYVEGQLSTTRQDSTTLNFSFTVVPGDFREILGGIRRRK